MATETTTIETTEFDDGSAIVTTTTTESEYIGDDSTETISEIAEEAAEESDTISEAVAIAEIEAERDITIAAIQAETTTAIIEAEQERDMSWQEELADLRANMMELTERVAALSSAQANRLIPEPLTEAPEELAAELAEEVAEAEAMNSIHEFTLTPTSETRTEVILENADGKQEARALATTRRKRRLI